MSLLRFNTKILNSFKTIPRIKIPQNSLNINSRSFSVIMSNSERHHHLHRLKEQLKPEEYDKMNETLKSFYNPISKTSYADCVLSKTIVRYERKSSIPEALTDDQLETLIHITK